MIIDFDVLHHRAVEYAKEDHTGARCGMVELDSIFRLEKGDLVVLCGNPNDGKSTFIQWYLHRLSLESGWKVCYLNFEGKEEETFWQIHSMYRNTETMRKYVYFSEIQDLRTIDQVTKDIADAKAQADIDCYVVDPYSNLLLGDVDTYTIAQDLAKLQAIGRRLCVTIILLCHPPKNSETISIYNIKGSSAFAERCDVGITLKRDWETNNTIIKVDKLRANGLRGKVKGEAVLTYNKFQFYPIDNNDVPFGKKVIAKRTGTQETPHKGQETKQIDNDTPTEETTRENEKIEFEKVCNLMVDVYKTANDKKPHTQGNLFQSVNVSNTNNEQAKDIIKAIRATNDIDEQRALKLKLPCVMVSVQCEGTKDKDNIKGYNNVICIDIDKKDNPKYNVEQMKEIVNQSPYVIYSCVSCGGRGLLALIHINGTQADFLGHFYALETYFKQMDIVIDKACKNLNRLRFVTFDEEPYINTNALVYTDTKETPTPTNLPQANVETKQLSKQDLETLAMIVTETKASHLQLTRNHDDTIYLANILFSMIGEDGRNYLHIFRQQREGYDEFKTDNIFTYVSTNTETYISNPIGALKAKFNQAVKEKNFN